MTQPEVWDRAAFDEMRTRLHARFDHTVAPDAFTVEAVRRPTKSGLTRVVLLNQGGHGSTWEIDTRTWAGSRIQHRTLATLEADLTSALAG
ncbi:hypothetical protein IC607_11115 [Cellulomonas sp. JH27-2]|uniref:hypothetical protein n=1 Tax=Cellulomonas sp. JH27-2 TaxID=2774139 RepID=UPI0017873DA3|nr:hypothetical protein [Cellulomonas sp. JH27-2]MBD8059516.1 hypothetical protein [Cellulomonas sp. JH27-2]